MTDYKFDGKELRDRRGSKIRDNYGSKVGEIDGQNFEIAMEAKSLNSTEGLSVIRMDRKFQPWVVLKQSLMESVVHRCLQCGFSLFVKTAT